MNKLTIIFLLSIVLFTSCKKEKPTIPNEVDPCLNAQPTTGDFTMEEQGYSSSTNTDTIYYKKNVIFNALQDDAEYQWHLTSSNGTYSSNDKSFYYYFGQEFEGQNVLVTLITTKKVNQLCLPNEKHTDTVYKNLHVSNLESQYSVVYTDTMYGAIEGSFRLKSDLLADSVDMKIYGTSKGDTVTFPIQTAFLNITNFNGIGDTLFSIAHRPRNYRQVKGAGIYMLNGNQILLYHSIHVRLDGLVEVEFNYSGIYNPNIPEIMKFYGRRL